MSDAAPLVAAISPALEPAEALRRCADLPHALLLDSALRHPTLGRYSFLAVDPFEFLAVSVAGQGALELLTARMAGLNATTLPELPPFQGGAAGLFGYELGRQWERVPRARIDEFQVPELAVGLYDLVVAWDHQRDQAWIVSQGFPETEPGRRRRRAEERLAQMQRWLARAPQPVCRRTTLPSIPAADLARQFATEADGWTSTFSQEGYLAAVEQAIDYIVAGDIFQVNLAQRLLHPAQEDALALYLRLRQCNAAPFAGYFDLGDFQILSASPERFLRLRERSVEVRPIKGTRPCTGCCVTDRDAGDELLGSVKDRAENVMIVDLLRNDLSRVCEPDSVVVEQLCGLEVYAFVQHLVSVIAGRLREGVGAVELLKAAFPGGSITGAPKIRAMEIIAELEPTARGAYCGSLGYLGFDGAMDLNLLIRTITAGRGWWQAPAGGGIVAQSIPLREYQETWHKAEGLLRALGHRGR